MNSSNNAIGGNNAGGCDNKVSSCSSSSSFPRCTLIEVCQGPDCTGLGGGIAILEIEELVREYRHHQITTNNDHGNENDSDNNNDNNMDTTERPELRVVAGGCRDFCSVGPNVHLLAAQRKERPRAAGGKSSKQSTTTRTKKTELLESFSNTKDPSSCDGAVKRAIAWAESTSSSSSLFSVNIENQASPSLSSPMDRHRSMMARKAERTRWETLKDVSRTIARCKKTVAANTNTITSSNDNDDNSNTIERKLRIWKESCKDGIERAAKPTARTTQREQRRTKRLVEIASETLDRICRDDDDESDSDSDSDTSSSSNENDSSDE